MGIDAKKSYLSKTWVNFIRVHLLSFLCVYFLNQPTYVFRVRHTCIPAILSSIVIAKNSTISNIRVTFKNSLQKSKKKKMFSKSSPQSQESRWTRTQGSLTQKREFGPPFCRRVKQSLETNPAGLRILHEVPEH